jgi:hypothetical protein
LVAGGKVACVPLAVGPSGLKRWTCEDALATHGDALTTQILAVNGSQLICLSVCVGMLG